MASTNHQIQKLANHAASTATRVDEVNRDIEALLSDPRIVALPSIKEDLRRIYDRLSNTSVTMAALSMMIPAAASGVFDASASEESENLADAIDHLSTTVDRMIVTGPPLRDRLANGEMNDGVSEFEQRNGFRVTTKHSEILHDPHEELQTESERLEDEGRWATQAYDSNLNVRLAAIGKIHDQRLLAELATDHDPVVQEQAFARLTDQGQLAELAMSSNSEIRAAAFDRLTDQEALARLAIEGNERVRVAAFGRLDDQALLVRLTNHADPLVRVAATGRLTDRRHLVRLTRDRDERVRRAAERRFASFRDMQWATGA